ncbi:MAG: FAD-dependent oxidoreductase [Mangrovicoccus sp.]|nr:FAD-dependent oxidoreductase [Mangrovicoccus sp.]
MPFDATRQLLPRIAVIGGGISGLSAAWQLAESAQVTLYEAEPRLGGHARTVVAGRRGDQPVDTGFIVFNYANYPHLTRLFRDLDVPVEKSCMSFGATIDGGLLEYGLKDLGALFAQRKNLGDPRFWGMVRDILRFNARAEAAAVSDDVTIADLVADLRLGDWFNRHYLMPICGAIWSTPADEVGAFPARTLVQFVRNHALLSPSGQHQWWTVSGGSVEYVRRLEAALIARGVTIRTASPVEAVRREAGRVTIRTRHGAEPDFDHVILATHPDRTLALLADPSEAERQALGAIRYQDNRVILHADTGQMPRHRRCWSSWVYQAETGAEGPGVGVTYWMNRLQNIPDDDPLFVTLNPRRPIDPAAIQDEVVFRHPVFDRAALRAQGQIAALQGSRSTWFAGAWNRHGFHEDGIASAVRVTRDLMRRQALDAQAAA